jgi:hypothetical protein
MPIISFLRVRQDREATEFRRWLLAQVEHTYEASSYCVLSLSEPPPSGFTVPAAMRLDASNSVPWPPYDAAILRGFDESLKAYPAGLNEWVDLEHIYRVARNVVKDDGSILDGRPSNGIKYLRGLIFHEDLPETAVRRSWARHALLAVEVHEGASRYVQWWVEEHLSHDAPKIGGIAELHFATDTALEERFFDSPRGMKEIAHDLGHFVAGGPPRLFARDYVYGSYSG